MNRSETDNTKKILESVDQFRIISDTFRNLGDTTRIRIFWLLCHYEECVSNIAQILDMSSPAVSHHLRALKASGLIWGKRKGKEVYYHSCDTVLCGLLHQMIEQVMEIACPDMESLPDHLDHTRNICISCSSHQKAQHEEGNSYQNDQENIIQQIHELLTIHMDKRWTVEELARMYLMNPTTLKDQFKAAYGNSIAAHIREHRMEHAALLIQTTGLSMGEIAQKTGYTSQSKFTAAFRKYYHMLPTQYRKKYSSSHK